MSWWVYKCAVFVHCDQVGYVTCLSRLVCKGAVSVHCDHVGHVMCLMGV